MAKFHCLGAGFAGACIFLGLSAGAVQAADACRKVNYSAERTRLNKLLLARDFPTDERQFLLSGIEQRLRDVKPGRLNARGIECGVQAVLALACLNETLPSTLQSLPSASRKTGKALWSKANVSSREAAVIGMFHACHASAMDAFSSGK